MRRCLWFVGIYLAGIVVIGTIAMLIRMVLIP